jgi:integrase
VIPLDDVTLEALAEHLARYPAASGELVFRTDRGGPVSRSTFAAAFRRARRAANMRPGSGLHELRHFYASMLIAGGRSVKEVQHRLGHSTPIETLRTYTHLWPDNEDGTRGVVAAVLGPALGRARPSDDDQGRPTMTNR